MYSLRRRLTLALALGFAALIVGAGLWTTHALGARVTEEFDSALLGRARTLAALTEQEGGKVELDYTPEMMPEFEREADPVFFQFWLDDGRVLLRSKRLSGDLPRLSTLTAGTLVGDETLPDGRPGRVARMAFVPRGAGEAKDLGIGAPGTTFTASPARRAIFLAVARGRGGLDASIAGTRWVVLGIGALATLLAALFVWRALAAGLRPVDAIAAQVRDLDADRLAGRVGLPRIPSEMAPVVQQLNALLDRLSTSIERERRFAANVAHELRTPIAELRSLAAVGSAWPDDAAAVARFFDDVGQIAGRMNALVADLLLLARCQAGVEVVERAPVSLRRVAAAAWADHAARASERGLRLRLDLAEDLAIESDSGKVAILFGNLLGNAVAHALPRSEVACRGSTDGERFRVEVENAAEPLGAEGLERLTEPFWRGDDARSSPDHAGLGLSLVAALAPLLGLEVRFDQDREGVFRARVEGSVAPGARTSERAPAPGPQETLRFGDRMEPEGGPA